MNNDNPNGEQGLDTLARVAEAAAAASGRQLSPPPPTITITAPEHAESSDIDVDGELLALVSEVDQKPQVVPFYTVPPVREAAKKSSKALGKVPVITAPPRAPSRRGKPGPKPGTSTRGRGRGRGRGGAAGARSSTVSVKKTSLLAQAQENRARSLLQAQSASTETKGDDPSPDDRVYCICKSNYDDDRIMIGCDRCDEWFHPSCVGLGGMDVEQIDVYVCPNCRKINPHLQITQKTICRRPGCSNSSRRQASKYCSDECGVLAMAALIETKGLDKKALWQTVKDVRRPEGSVVDQQGQARSQKELWSNRREFDVARMKEQLAQIERERQELQQLVAITDLRHELLDLSIARLHDLQQAEEVECGWDMRWLWDDEEIRKGFEDGSFMEGYPDGPLDSRRNNYKPKPTLCSAASWWCVDGLECPRHLGWVKLLQEDLELEKADQTTARSDLTARERDIRMRMDNPDALPMKATATDANGPPEDKADVLTVEQPTRRKRASKKSKV